LAYNLSASVCICTSRAAFTSHTFGMGRGLLDRVAKCAHRLIKCQVVRIVRSHDMGPSPSCHEHLHFIFRVTNAARLDRYRRRTHRAPEPNPQ
jgi:hypothetical protein